MSNINNLNPFPRLYIDIYTYGDGDLGFAITTICLPQSMRKFWKQESEMK